MEEIKYQQNIVYVIATDNNEKTQYISDIKITKNNDEKFSGVTAGIAYTTPGRNMIKLIIDRNILYFEKKSEADHILNVINDIYCSANMRVVKVDLTCNCTFV